MIPKKEKEILGRKILLSVRKSYLSNINNKKTLCIHEGNLFIFKNRKLLIMQLLPTYILWETAQFSAVSFLWETAQFQPCCKKIYLLLVECVREITSVLGKTFEIEWLQQRLFDTFRESSQRFDSEISPASESLVLRTLYPAWAICLHVGLDDPFGSLPVWNIL